MFDLCIEVSVSKELTPVEKSKLAYLSFAAKEILGHPFTNIFSVKDGEEGLENMKKYAKENKLNIF